MKNAVEPGDVGGASRAVGALGGRVCCILSEPRERAAAAAPHAARTAGPAGVVASLGHGGGGDAGAGRRLGLGSGRCARRGGGRNDFSGRDLGGPASRDREYWAREDGAAHRGLHQRPLISRRLSLRGARSAPWQSDCFGAALFAMTVCLSREVGITRRRSCCCCSSRLSGWGATGCG